jgi:hypothetical protein
VRVLLIFIDGIGLGEDDPETNPFANVDLPVLHALSGGQRWLASTGPQTSERALFIPTDPRMGVAGRPQSATGQAAILTGLNVPEMIGEHYGPKPNEPVRAILDEDNLFMQVVAAGKMASMLEAYPPPWHEGVNSGKRIPASYQYAVRAADLPFFGVDELRRGDALSGDWTNEGWRSRLDFPDMPLITPYAAGVRLVELARRYDFAFMAHWLTDMVGHRGSIGEAVGLLTTFDQVMAGVLDTWDDTEGVIVITSDHGNMEVIGSRTHTLNDVPTVIIGDARHAVGDGLAALNDIAPRLARLLLDGRGD